MILKKYLGLALLIGVMVSGALWASHGYGWAENVAVFYGWLAAFCGVLCAFITPTEKLAVKPIGVAYLENALLFSLLVLYVCMGHFMLGFLFVIGWAGAVKFAVAAGKIAEAKC